MAFLRKCYTISFVNQPPILPLYSFDRNVKNRPTQLKYQRVEAEIRQFAQTLPLGAKLPAERDLAVSYECNFLTVRKALKRLVDDGTIVRRVGSGTFIARHPGRGKTKRLARRRPHRRPRVPGKQRLRVSRAAVPRPRQHGIETRFALDLGARLRSRHARAGQSAQA